MSVNCAQASCLSKGDSVLRGASVLEAQARPASITLDLLTSEVNSTKFYGRSVLPSQLQDRIASRLRLAMGLVETAKIGPSSSEYDIRNSLSRMYYAFFHASLALLLATESQVERVSRNHGMVHERVQRRFGKTTSITKTMRELYGLRRESDYETDMFATRYRGNIEEARQESILLLKRAKKDFYWLYYEARKSL
jgi:uncharacterized protein (UPF0332 family)